MQLIRSARQEQANAAHILAFATVGQCLRTRRPMWRLLPPALARQSRPLRRVLVGSGGEHSIVLAPGTPQSVVVSVYDLAVTRARKVPLAMWMPSGRLEYMPIGRGEHNSSTETLLCWQSTSPFAQSR